MLKNWSDVFLYQFIVIPFLTTRKKWPKNAHWNYIFHRSSTIWSRLPPVTSTSLQGWVPQWSNFLVSSLFQAFRRCRVRVESREKIAIKRNRKKNYFMNRTMRGRGGKRRWINYNMDPSCFPLHTSQVTLAIYITPPSLVQLKTCFNVD